MSRLTQSYPSWGLGLEMGGALSATPVLSKFSLPEEPTLLRLENGMKAQTAWKSPHSLSLPSFFLLSIRIDCSCQMNTFIQGRHLSKSWSPHGTC